MNFGLTEFLSVATDNALISHRLEHLHQEEEEDTAIDETTAASTPNP